MGILNIVAGLFKPAADLVDNLHTSEEEKLALKTQLDSIAANLSVKLIEAQSRIIVSESQGTWLQRNWRPITMLTFLALIVCDQFGILLFRLSTESFTVLKIGLGGYVVGRSVEKIAETIKNGMDRKRS